MKNLKLSSKSKGVITIEAVLVFTTVVFVTIMMFFLGLLLFQNARYQTLANSTAERAALINNIESRDMYIGKVSMDALKNSDPYRFIFDADQGAKEQRAFDILDLEKERKNLISEKTNTTRTATANVDIQNHFLSKRVVVNIHSDFNVPIVGIFKMFGVPSPFEINVYSAAGVQEQAELIRNIDCCSDILKYVDYTLFDGKVSTKGTEVLTKITDFISKLKQTN